MRRIGVDESDRIGDAGTCKDVERRINGPKSCWSVRMVYCNFARFAIYSQSAGVVIVDSCFLFLLRNRNFCTLQKHPEPPYHNPVKSNVAVGGRLVCTGGRRVCFLNGGSFWNKYCHCYAGAKWVWNCAATGGWWGCWHYVKTCMFFGDGGCGPACSADWNKCNGKHFKEKWIAEGGCCKRYIFERPCHTRHR